MQLPLCISIERLFIQVVVLIVVLGVECHEGDIAAFDYSAGI